MMKQKAFALLGFFTVLVMALSVVSATSSIYLDVSETVNAPTSVNETAGSFTFTFDVNYTKQSDEAAVINFSESSSNFGSVSISPTTLNGTANETKTITGTATGFSGMNGSTMLIKISANVEGQTYTDNETSFSVSIVTTTPVTPSDPDEHDLCGTDYNDSILRVKVTDEELDNKDAWEWKPLDNIELEVEIDNIGDDDYEYSVNLYFFKDEVEVNGDIASDEDDLEFDGFDVDEGKDEVETVNFQIDGQVEAGDYDLFVKVVREDDDECYVKLIKTNVEIKKQTRQVVVKDVEASDSIKAGETVSFEVEIANVGRNDEDKVKIHAYNKDLGINLYKEIDNLDEGDTEIVTFLITIPSTAKQGSYGVHFSTQYDYDDRDEKYDEVSDSDDDMTYSITVFGMTTAPTIGAKLTSDAKVGKELTIDVTLTNNGDESETYDLIIEGASWAKNVELDDDSVLVKAGETKTVQLTLVPQESGAQAFTVKAVYGDEIKKQTVSVNIAAGATGFLTGAFAGVGTLSYLIWAIVILVILILIIAIIKLAKPRRRVESIAY